MTTSNGRSTDGRRAGRSAGQWLLGLLIVLALAASILMVFTDQLSIVGSLAVIAALWAAVIGAILVTKFRRQADSAEAKSRDLRLVYELQLEREIAARRQYELDVETTIRKEVSAESNEELAALKEQVISLRSSLEILLGESLPDQRAALPNEKLRELASGLGQNISAPDDGTLAARDFAATAPAADNGRHIPAGVDPNEMTEVIPIVTDDPPLSGRIAAQVPTDAAPGSSTPTYGSATYGTPTHGAPSYGTGTSSRGEPVEATVEEPVGSYTPSGATEDDTEQPTDVETVEPAPSSVPFARVPDATRRPGHAGTYTSPGYGSTQPPSGQSPTTHSSSDAGQSGTGQTGTGPPLAPAPSYGAPAAASGRFPAGPYVEDAPTDEWATPEPTGHAPADASAPAAAPDAASAPTGTYGGPDQTPPPFAPGRHESSDGSATGSQGRRRRREPEDDDSAHSAGLPVSELLSQLRQSGSPGGGRRRRED